MKVEINDSQYTNILAYYQKILNGVSEKHDSLTKYEYFTKITLIQCLIVKRVMEYSSNLPFEDQYN